jgi:nucleotide-binding universal stress UspA family protein
MPYDDLRGWETVTIQPGEHERRIVVGVDGSVPSKTALAWAIRQARLTGAAVDAVIAWEVPLTVRTPWPLTWTTDFRGLAEHLLADVIAEVPGTAGQVEIRPKVMEGDPARVLLEAAAGADLLVVGHRGHGGLVEALLGSVSQQCVHHATCPVAVIRGSLASPADEAAEHSGQPYMTPG